MTSAPVPPLLMVTSNGRKYSGESQAGEEVEVQFAAPTTTTSCQSYDKVIAVGAVKVPVTLVYHESSPVFTEGIETSMSRVKSNCSFAFCMIIGIPSQSGDTQSAST